MAELLASFKVEGIVEQTKLALAEGHAVVIGMQSTGAAAAANAAERRADEDGGNANDAGLSSPSFETLRG